jgi:hypothetical protein
MNDKALELAVLFHVIYERKSAEFDYVTRTETRIFDPESKNGKLMVATCEEILQDYVPRADLETAQKQVEMYSDSLERTAKLLVEAQKQVESARRAINIAIINLKSARFDGQPIVITAALLSLANWLAANPSPAKEKP